MKASWYLTGGVAALAIAAPFVLNIVYAKVEDVPAGSLEYWLGVPDRLKGVPVVQPCAAPLYSGAGEAGRMRYTSQGTPEHLVAVMQSHFNAEACVAQDSDNGLRMLCEDGAQVTVTTMPGGECAALSIEVSR